MSYGRTHDSGLFAVSEEDIRATQTATAARHVLLVDDEELVATMWTRLLETLGYQVSAFTDSPDALEAFRQDPDAFDLVITDQMMPRLTGLELVAALRILRTDIPIILMTGFSNAITTEIVRELDIQAFMMKPVAVPKLADTIHKVLEGDQESPS